MGERWRGPAMRVLYDYCGYCQEATAWDVRPDLRPFVDRKVGVRCRVCGKEDAYTFRQTPKAEREYQAEKRRQAGDVAAKRGELARGWLDFHVEQSPPLAMPAGDTDPPTPRWEFLRWRAHRGDWAGPDDRAAPGEPTPETPPETPPAPAPEPTPAPERLPGVYHDWHRPLPSHDQDPDDEDEGCRGK